MTDGPTMYEVRCPECNSLLLKVGTLTAVETVCRKCKVTVSWPTIKGQAVPRPLQPGALYPPE